MTIIPFIIFIPILAMVALCDYKRQTIPNKITYPAAVLAITLNLFFLPWPVILGGGLLAFIIGLLLKRFAGAGSGDVKLMGVVGVMFGMPVFLAVMLGGFMLGSIVSLVLFLSKREGPGGQTIPFGMYLSLSGIIVCGWLIFVIWGA